MCLVVVAHRAHAAYPLAVAANRDEFHARPSDPLHWWPDPPVLAGRDRQAGGTWFAVDRHGSFAAVTNYRDPAGAEPGFHSRGELPLRALQAATAGTDLATADYAGVNLLVGDHTGLHYSSNRGDSVAAVAPGVHALSNGHLDTPWPKARRGVEAVTRLLNRADVGFLDAWFALLADRTQPPDSELPDTGVGLELERQLAPVFVVGRGYGTRCSTVLLVSAAGRITVAERRFDAAGRALGTAVERFMANAGMPDSR